MTDEKLPAKTSSARDIDAFLKRAAKLPTLAQTKGRLIFAIDATMSRQPTWNRATEIQSDMFDVAHSIGGLAVQLVFFRGAGEFHASEWTASANVLAGRMRDVTCRSGFTQLRRVLAGRRRRCVAGRRPSRAGRACGSTACAGRAPRCRRPA